jgi:2-polyprenyl-3-methyl-5-hydroxy-6-metoxy-1,4-benzoquinol methylase
MDLPQPPPPAIRVIWPDAEQPPYERPCPNCGASGAKPHLLDVAWTAPKLKGGDRKPVFACPACTARFYPPLDVPNYHDPDVMDWGWHQFHIQQGAGLVPITETIGRIARPAGTRFLEIGCGYGFGLDFAIHALGWQGLGIDPSPMARLGAADLGITINDGYFPQADPAAALWDVIAATEVIEHVETPADLLAAIRARLNPGGLLLLTTPDGAAITRETPEAALVQLLAPGIHMVFQTATSLRRLLDRAGFTGAVMGHDGLTLVAYAGTTDDALIDDDELQRRRFRTYLTARAEHIPPTTDLGLGFAGRALFEAAIDLDWPAARTMRDRLWPAIQARFGLDLDTIDALPPAFAPLSLAELKDHMPLNLGMILYAEASRLRADPVTRDRAAPLFLLASAAASTLHAALARLSLNDGLAEELSWRGIAEAAIEAARSGNAAALPRFAALHKIAGAAAERAAIVWRGVIELTNAGATPLARDLLARERLTTPPPDLPDGVRRDAQIVIAQLALAPDGDPLGAIAMAEALGPADPAYATLLGGAFVRLVNRARFTEALPYVPQVTAACTAGDSAAATDARNALAIAIERGADPAAIPALLRPIPLDPARRDAILLEAFCRLVDTGRYEAAISMADAENIVSRAVARDDPAGRNARLALALLDLATGDPLDVPTRLAGLAIDEQRRRDILIGAFSRLVNAARYQDAQAYATAQAIAQLAAPEPDTSHDAVGRDATIGLAILDLVTGDPAEAPRRIATIDIDAQRRRQITLGAFVTLVNRGRYDDAATLRATTPIDTWAAITIDDDAIDASIALIALTLVAGDPAAVPALLAQLPGLSPEAQADARAQAALRLIHLGRLDEARPLIALIDYALLDPASRIDLIATEAHFAIEDHATAAVPALLDALETDHADPIRVKNLALRGFVTAVNRGDFADAALLRPRIEPDFTNYAKATTDALRGAGFALGVLDLQDPPQPHRAEAAFAAVRRGFAAELTQGDAAPPLFWESLRGELIALHQTGRAAEANALGRAMLDRYGAAPDDLALELKG